LASLPSKRLYYINTEKQFIFRLVIEKNPHGNKTHEEIAGIVGKI
jgi:hypothetical protein